MNITQYIFVLLWISFLPVSAQKKKNNVKKDNPVEQAANGLKFRSIGPAFTSGRIADFAVNPCNPAEYYVAAASGPYLENHR